MKNEVLELECIDLTIEGLGVCRNDGKVYFVKGMLPGELALVKVVKETSRVNYGIVSELLRPNEHRCLPDCSIAYKCGGCDLRHVDYDYQLILKKKLLENTFAKMGIEAEIGDIVGDDEPLYYRNKVQVPVRDGKFGFYRKNSNDIVEFEECFIQSVLANRIVLSLKAKLLRWGVADYFRHILIKHAQGTGEVMLGLIVKEKTVPHISEVVEEIVAEFPAICSVILNINKRNDNVILGEEEVLLLGRDYIEDVFAGIRVRLSLKSFYQVNTNQMVKLYDQVVKVAEFDGEQVVLDLFSGIGTISLYVSRFVKAVTGVEIVESAVLNARDNALMNGIKNAEFFLDDASARLDHYLAGKDVVIVDPPRKGLSRDLIASLVDSGIGHIVYVSCNPATLARDLKIFGEWYDFSYIQPVDMFPGTLHCECVVSLKRKANG